MRFLSALLFVVCASAADWNFEKATAYLDARQRAWEDFKPAKAPHGTCVSCHTGMGYILLRQALNQPAPTAMETNLYTSLRGRLASAENAPAKGVGASVESVLAALLLSKEAESGAALERMFRFQIREGEDQGGFPWFSLQLDPWEWANSRYFGAAIAAVAISQAPAPYRERSEVKALLSYLDRAAPNQPLHNRLTLLWTRDDLIEKRTRQQIMEQAWSAQGPDGGWSIHALGPWVKPPREEAAKGSDTYATALAAYSLRKGGSAKSDPRLQRALAWLSAHQDRSSGAWPSTSMNKQFESDSMMVHFMTDAATAYAVLALLQ
jgi:squalene-hopene/tetraprenyl-beta-curcumene cyclase